MRSIRHLGVRFGEHALMKKCWGDQGKNFQGAPPTSAHHHYVVNNLTLMYKNHSYFPIWVAWEVPKFLGCPQILSWLCASDKKRYKISAFYSVCKILCLLVAITILSNRLCSSGIMQAVTYIYWHLFQISNWNKQARYTYFKKAYLPNKQTKTLSLHTSQPVPGVKVAGI